MNKNGVLNFSVTEYVNGKLFITISKGLQQARLDAYSSEVNDSGIAISHDNQLYTEDNLGNPVYNDDFKYCRESVSEVLSKLFEKAMLRKAT